MAELHRIYIDKFQPVYMYKGSVTIYVPNRDSFQVGLKDVFGGNTMTEQQAKVARGMTVQKTSSASVGYIKGKFHHNNFKLIPE